MIFNARSYTLEQKLQALRRQEAETRAAFVSAQSRVVNAGRFVATTTAWAKPPAGWLKLNVDGSVAVTSGQAGCGGVLRDHQGCWKGGFMYKIGTCSVAEGEEWGVLQGLCMASRLGVRKLILECDSKTTIDILQGSTLQRCKRNNIITRCMEMMQKFEDLKLGHVYREQNRVAYALAKQARMNQPGLTLIDEVPNGLCSIVMEDNLGARFSRQIPAHGAGNGTS